MKNITFNSKATYLAYRSVWKAEYKQLSVEIRTLRLAERFYQRKLALSARQTATAPQSAQSAPEAKQKPVLTGESFGLIVLTEGEERWLAAAQKICLPALFGCNRMKRSKRATEMLVELKQAKLEAQRQYLARKASQAQAGG